MANKKNKTGAALKDSKAENSNTPTEQRVDQREQNAPDQQLLGDPLKPSDQSGVEQQDHDTTNLINLNAGGDGEGESTELPPVSEADDGVQKVTPPNQPTPKSKFNKRCEEVAAEYASHYPASDAFHFCSDMQVFLSGDKADADAHQLEVNPQIKVFTVNI
ncbi:MAG: hypothetical protein RSB32_07445 [Mucinivorans sp.]